MKDMRDIVNDLFAIATNLNDTANKQGFRDNDGVVEVLVDFHHEVYELANELDKLRQRILNLV